jgi:hypothetical protein
MRHQSDAQINRNALFAAVDLGRQIQLLAEIRLIHRHFEPLQFGREGTVEGRCEGEAKMINGENAMHFIPHAGALQ